MHELEIIRQLAEYGVTVPGGVMLFIIWRQYLTIQALKLELVKLKVIVESHDNHINKG